MRATCLTNPILLDLITLIMFGGDSSVHIALGYGLDDRGSRVRFPAGAGNFSFTTASRTALGPTQLRIQWVPGALSLGVKRPRREADHSPPYSAEVEMRGANLPLSNTPSSHGAQLNNKSTGTTLTLPFALMMFVEVYKLWSFSICSLLHFPPLHPS
jgi:hypothetical protein